MIEPSVQFQKAVFSALNAASIDADIYEIAPPNCPFPFIVIGEDVIETDPEYADIPWWICTTTIQVFSQPTGIRSRRELKTLIGQVVLALNVRLSLTDFYVYEWKHEDTQDISDKDGVTLHAMVKFCYKVQPIDSLQ